MVAEARPSRKGTQNKEGIFNIGTRHHYWKLLLRNRRRNLLLALILLVAGGSFLQVPILPLDVSIVENAFHQPKVAFLFLTRETMPLEFIWDQFFESADPSKPYSVYIHSRPGIVFNSNLTSCRAFLNRQIPDSVMVRWGELSMVEAEQRLLQNALKDPLNHRFVLLSESCLPLHDYDYVYDYLFYSRKSFLDSFRDSADRVQQRYNPEMAPVVALSHWRKGSQWFALIRKHAQLVAMDKEIFSEFQQHCKRARAGFKARYPKGKNKTTEILLDCVPDEHFVQAVLAVKGREHELVRRSLTYGHWEIKGGKAGPLHPKTFDTSDVTPNVLNSMQVIESVTFATEQRTEHCGTKRLPQPCFLFARKFTRGAGLKIVKRMPALIGLPYRASKAATGAK